MRLHFSIGCYDYRRTARLRQSIHFSITQVLFADHMHWRAGVHNKILVPQVSEFEKNVALSCSPKFNTLLVSFHAASRVPCSCNSVYCTFVIILLFLDLSFGCSWQCAKKHFSPNLQPLFVLSNKHSGGCHLSQNELMQVPLKYSLQVHRNILRLGLLPLGLRVLDAFCSFCYMKEFGDVFDCVLFPRLLISWRKLQLSPSIHCPLDNNLQEFFTRCIVPWFLTTTFLS